MSAANLDLVPGAAPPSTAGRALFAVIAFTIVIVLATLFGILVRGTIG